MAIRLHLRPLPAQGDVIPFPNSRDEANGAIKAQLQNMFVALAQRHGEREARMMLAGGTIGVVAASARRQGVEVSTFYALAIGIQMQLLGGDAEGRANG